MRPPARPALCLRVASFLPLQADLGFPFMDISEAVVVAQHGDVLRCLCSQGLAPSPTSITLGGGGEQRHSRPAWINSLTSDLLPDVTSSASVRLAISCCVR